MRGRPAEARGLFQPAVAIGQCREPFLSDLSKRGRSTAMGLLMEHKKASSDEDSKAKHQPHQMRLPGFLIDEDIGSR